jgi:hypothetical protein
MSHKCLQKYRFVELSYPNEDGNSAIVSTFKIKNKNDTIYETVEKIEKDGSKKKQETKEVKKPIILREVINLHNSNGIKDLDQIKLMVKEINSGKDIISKSGFPNIKLIKTQNSEWVLFDGHHSLLSYMIAGRTYLHEVPHIVVQNENGYVDNEEIQVFFGKHSEKLSVSNWRQYVINWQATEEKQLCKREQNNMGELLDSIH